MDERMNNIRGLTPQQRELLLRRAQRLASGEDPEHIARRKDDSNMYPLSFAQQRLWFLDRLNPGNPFYNVAFGTRITGPLDARALLESLREIVRRHDTLRTRFTLGDGTGAQVVSGEARFDLAIVELGGYGNEERERKAYELAGMEAERQYNLETDPMLRVMLIGMGDEEHVLIRVMHHIMCDGWSLGVFNRELETLYDACRSGRASPLAPLPIQYADFALWQREWLQGEEMHSQLAWWLDKLEGAETVLRIPADRPRTPVQAFNGAIHSFTLSPTIRDRLRPICEREGVTLYMALLAAFQALLHRYTGQRCIVVGSPIANRNRKETEELIGFFANTLVVRSDFPAGLTYRQLMHNVREMTIGAFSRQDLPFEKLVDSLKLERSLSYTPLVQVAFALQNAPRQELCLSGLSTVPYPVARTASIFDMTLHIWETSQDLSCAVEYATDLFDEVSMALMCEDFRSLLETVTADPDASIDRPAIPASITREELERKRRIASLDAAAHAARAGSHAERLQAILAMHPRIRSAVAVERRGEGSAGVETVVYVVPKARIQRPAGGPELHRLPDGMTVFHLNRNETEFMYREIFEDRCYLKHGITLPEGACVFDVGANIGLFSLFASLERGSAVIYAFEPVLPLFEILKANADRYGANVTALNFGLSDAKRTIPMTFYPRSSVQSGYCADEAWDAAVLRAYVENEFREHGAPEELTDDMREELLRNRLRSDRLICRFDSLSNVLRLLDIERIDLLKIDVEKSELDVLAGIAEGDWRRIRQIVLELHDVDGRLERVTELLRSKGYRLVVEQDPLFTRTGIYTVYAGDGVRHEEERRPMEPAALLRPAARDAAPLSAAEIVSFLRVRMDGGGPMPRIEICDAIPEDISRTAAETERGAGADLQPMAPADRISLVVSATFTADPIAEHLDWFLRQGGIEADISFAPYNQVFQQLLDDDSISSRNDGANVVLLRFEDLIRGRTDLGEAELVAALDDAHGRLLSALRARAQRTRATYIVALLPGSGETEQEPLPAAVTRRIDAFAEGMRAAVGDLDTMHVFDLRSIGECYRIGEAFDRQGDRIAHMPFSQPFYAALGAGIARIIWSWRKPPFKAIVVDCDNTLWKGVCGEDGAEGVRVEPFGEGKPFHDLQGVLKDRMQSGMLLALCSKNAESDVWNVFEKNRHMVLSRADIAAARVNWLPKSSNIKEIAQELNIGLDSFVFLDDEPAEIADVRANCPEVLSLQLPREPACFARFLQHVWAFDQFSVTDVDKERTRMYRAEQERRVSMERAPSLKDFLAALELTVAIRSPRNADHDRMAQLTHRTNQFNMNGVRRTAEEIREYTKSGGSALVVELRDRFGYYGLVGLLMFREEASALVLDTFLLSCRALGKGVEDAMLEGLRSRCAGSRITDLVARYVPTERNAPFGQFLDRTGWGERAEGEGRSLALSARAFDCAHVTMLHERSLVDEAAPDARTAPNAESIRTTAPPGVTVHHIGIAVPALDAGRTALRSLGFACGESVHDSRQNVIVSMCKTPAGACIELVAGVDDRSPCNRILETAGGGPYHLGMRVAGIGAFLSYLESQGCRYTTISEPTPAPLFSGSSVAFVDIIGLGLVELVEVAAEPGPGDRAADGGAVTARIVTHDAAETSDVLRRIGYEPHGGASQLECGVRTLLLKKRDSIDVEIVQPLGAETREHAHLTRHGTSLLEILIAIAPGESDPSPSAKTGWEEIGGGERYGVLAGARRVLRVPGVRSLILHHAGEGAGENDLCAGWDAGAFNRHSLKRREYLIPLDYHTGALLLGLPLRDGKERREATETRYVPPRTELERMIAGLWERLLGVDRIGAEDDFFKIGGNSIIAVQVITRILKDCSVELPLSAIFETPTVGGLAETIENYRWLADAAGRTPDEGGGKSRSARDANDETVEF
jgi:FkbH-like protein/FkbM family methyltransferase